MRTCKVCRAKYKPKYNTLQAVCDNIQCALEHGKKLQKKEFKARTKVLRKEQRKHDRQWHIKTAQREFNKFIRLRDRREPCISCGTTKDLKYDAGHYRSVGSSPELRFVEDNCHKQCSFLCNQTRTGNVKEYRIGLIKKIGLERVDFLEGPHPKKYYRIPELQELIAKYRALNKTLAV